MSRILLRAMKNAICISKIASGTCPGKEVFSAHPQVGVDTQSFFWNSPFADYLKLWSYFRLIKRDIYSVRKSIPLKNDDDFALALCVPSVVDREYCLERSPSSRPSTTTRLHVGCWNVGKDDERTSWSSSLQSSPSHPYSNTSAWASSRLKKP